MALDYNPQEASKNCWPKADYHATLISVTEGVSKTSGNPMETWQIGVYHPDGREQTIKEYVTRKSVFKLKQLAVALGKRDEYNAGAFQAEDQIGATFIVTLSVEEDDEYGDKNRIERIKASPRPAATPPRNIGEAARQQIQGRPAATDPIPAGTAFKPDDIPF